MSTNAGSIEVQGRPVGFVVWGAIVSLIAAAALVMSAVALTRADRSTTGAIATGVTPVLWDASKLEAMQGRALAGSVGVTPVLWDASKLDAMQGRALAG